MNLYTFQKELLSLKRNINLKLCMHPDQEACKGDIIRAHSIHRKGILLPRAKNGMVTMIDFDPDLSKMAVFDINLTEEGTKKATTFRNFCSHHDKQLFIAKQAIY